MKIAVIGTGYVGLVTGVCLADKGFDVACVDVDSRKIQMLNEGRLPIYEPGLKDILDGAVKRNHLTFSTDIKKVVVSSKIIFICVGTPSDNEGRADLSAIFSVAATIASTLKENPVKELKIIITKSTVPVGTGDKIEQIFDEHNVKNIAVVSNPEFLKEGAAIEDFASPDRVVVGTDSQEAWETIKEMYLPFTRKTERIFLMDRRSAELTKYAANAMLALRISFINQIAALCEKVDADVSDVRKGIGSDSRIGPAFLYPGPGYGGSCFPKDVRALIHLAKDHKCPLTIMESVDSFNNKQKFVLAEKVKNYFGAGLKNKTLAVWGLSFKPKTDDVRESPAISIINNILAAGASVKAYDPEAVENFKRVGDFSRVVFCSSMYDAVESADALLVVTDWNEFKMPDFERIKKLMRTPVIFDGRNLYSPSKMKELGISYFGFGRR
jgi:UDPglucose 6-dehydrogenase